MNLFSSWIWWVIPLGIALVTLLILYLLGVFRRELEYRVENFPSPETPNFIYSLGSLSNSLITEGKPTGFWIGASDIFTARLDAIRSAKSSIQFETFIMTPGRRADEFAEAIAYQAHAGVKVQLIVDSYGTKSIPKAYWKRLRSAGVELRFFNSFSGRNPLEYLHRSHRKLLLIDRQVALIGGAGVSDYWDGVKTTGTVPWLDFEVRFQGPVAAKLEGIFQQHWLDLGGIVDFRETAIDLNPSDRPAVLITLGEDPTYKSSPIRNLFKTQIIAARESFWIASPYFLPNQNLRELFLKAKKAGVDVRILTMGKRSDKKFIHYTSRELYGSLLRGGIKIYEYQPSMMHAKVTILDRHLITIGSANLDPRSFFRNDEFNLSAIDGQLSQEITNFFQDAFADSLEVNQKEWHGRSLWQRLIGRFWLLFYLQL